MWVLLKQLQISAHLRKSHNLENGCLFLYIILKSIFFFICAQNGTFVGPVLVVPMMMFSGFGVTIQDIPKYLKWGSELSYLRYGLEGYIAAIYGLGRPEMDCDELYCHYKKPSKFLSLVEQSPDHFWSSSVTLLVFLIAIKVIAYFLLSWRIKIMR